MRYIDDVVSNERLEELSEYDCADRYEVMSMATELLALRKERERAEPGQHEAHIRREVNAGGNTWIQCSKQAFEREKARGSLCRVLYESPPAPVVPEAIKWPEEKFCSAPPAPEVPAAYEINDDATDYHLGWNACRAAMLNQK